MAGFVVPLVGVIARAGPFILKGVQLAGRAVVSPVGRRVIAGGAGFGAGVVASGPANSGAGLFLATLGLKISPTGPVGVFGLFFAVGSFAGDMGLREDVYEGLKKMGLIDSKADIADGQAVFTAFVQLNIDPKILAATETPIVFMKSTAILRQVVARSGGYGLAVQVLHSAGDEGPLNMWMPEFNSKMFDFMLKYLMNNRSRLYTLDTGEGGSHLQETLLIQDMARSLRSTHAL